MECHKCPVNDEIEAGVYKASPWEEIPCAACPVRIPDNHHGRSHVRLPVDGRPVSGPTQGGSARNNHQNHMVRHDSELVTHPVFAAEGPADPRDMLIEAMAYLCKQMLQLTPRAREIVLDRLAYPARPLRVVAARLGVSLQTAHKCLRDAREAWPALRYAIPMKHWKWKTKAEKLAMSSDGKHYNSKDSLFRGLGDPWWFRPGVQGGAERTQPAHPENPQRGTPDR